MGNCESNSVIIGLSGCRAVPLLFVQEILENKVVHKKGTAASEKERLSGVVIMMAIQEQGV